MALAAYRHVLRSASLAFKGDLTRLSAAQSAARERFEFYRHAQPSEAEAQIEHAESVAQILRENLVQGVAQEDTESGKYKLRIHEHTERGDNESIIAAKGKRTIGQCSPL